MKTQQDPQLSCTVGDALPLRPLGTVFSGTLAGFGAPVLVAKLGDDPETLARARRALSLEHPGIAQSLAIVALADGPALAQALLPGRPLAALDDAARAELQPAMLAIIDHLLSAFEHAHSRGVTHGDLTADDLVFDGTRVHIRGFGYARPSRPPSPRYDLSALGKCLASLIGDDALKAMLAAPTSDAGALRRSLRDTAERRSNKSAGSADALARTTASPSQLPSQTPSPPQTPSSSQTPSPSPFATPRLAQSGAVGPRFSAASLIGRKLGDFVVREKMAEGGLGMVFRAEQASLGRRAVIKVPFTRRGTSDRLRARFLHEAQLASRLDHPYAAHVYAFGNEPEDSLMWIAMELVDGTPLDEYLRVCGPMPPARAAGFIGRLAEVIHRAHELSIVHRDIKPSNVMVLQRSGRLLPKLLDFGIARDASVQRSDGAAPTTRSGALGPTTAPLGSLTLRGAVMGSPLYMAPEQWVDASEAGPAADIYSLAVLSYEVLTGQPPFNGTSVTEVERLHKSAPVPSLGLKLPRALDAALARGLAKRAADRYATALELAAALDAAAGGGAEAAPLPQLDEALRLEVLERAPPPIAETVAALAAARNAHQALAALDAVVDAAASFVGVVALAARSRGGAPVGGDSERALALVRELGRRVLEPGEWIELARELVRPYVARPGLHPLGELVELLAATPGPFDELVARRAQRRDVSDERVRGELGDSLGALARLLEALRLFACYRVVVRRRGAAEAWAGVRRGARPPIVLRGDGIADGEPLLVDADGVPLLRLHPLVQIEPPMPGGVDEMFVLAGSAGDAARLLALPQGFERSSSEVPAWLRAQLFADGADARAPGPASERPPYRGLQPFTADDADNFIGRERERDAFLNRLRVQPLLAVVGRSGSGKSSFVHAGVVPHLPAGWRARSMRPGAAPLATLAALLAHAGDAAAQEGEQLVVVVDQFEELFTLCRDAAERERFARELTALADGGRARVVLTLRDDFLLPAEELEALRDRLGPALVLLAAPGAADLERILVEPARRRGYAFDDPELPRRIVREVEHQPGGLPMLSFAAAELWERRDRHFQKLLVRAYDAMGGVTGALVGHAEATLAAMTAAERTLVRDVFRRLVTAEGTRAVIGKRELVETLGDAARGASAVEKLVVSRLVVASEGAGGVEQIEVAHEMLLSTWPRLVEWRREDREGARLRDQLRDAARQWTERGRSPGLLWRDDALVELKLWRKKHEGGLSAVESEFAAASLDAERRGVRRRRAGIVVGFVVMAAVSLVLWTLNRRAERATAETRARLVESYLAQARTKLLGGRRWEALASLVAAQKMGAASPAIDMMRALAREPARALERRWRVNAGRAWSVDYSPDGALLVTTGEDGAALWEAATGTLRARLVGHAGDVRDGGFSPDGAHVATIGFDATVRIWDGHTGAAERVLRGHRSSVRCMAWRPDGTQLLTTDLSGDVHVWDLASGASVFRQIVDSPVTSCSFADSKLAFGSWSGDVFVGEGDRAEKIGRHDDRVRSVRFDRSGKRLVSAGADTTVRVWDVASRRMLTLLRGASEELLQASLSPDGARVVAASHDGTARVWDLASGQLQLTLTGHHGGLWSAVFDGTGTRILTSADDGSARLWDAVSGLPLAVLEGHDKAILRPRFSPDGAHVATASYDGTAAIWKADPTFFVAKVDGWPRTGMTSMSESRHRQVAIASALGTRVWRPEAPRQLVDLPPSQFASATRERAIALGEQGKELRVFALPSGRLERTIAATAPIASAAVDEARIGVADEGGLVRIFDADGRLRWSVRTDAGLIVLLDGDRWLSATNGGLVRVFDGDRVVAVLQGPAFGADSLSRSEWSPDGGTLALAGGKSVVLVRLRGTPTLRALPGHDAPILTVRFDRDGRRLVTTSEDGTGGLWDLASGRLVHRLVPKGQYLADARFDDSGRVVVGVDGQGGLELFDAEGGQLSGFLEGNGHAGYAVEPTSDGALAVLSRWGELAVWRIEPDRAPLADVERELACKAPPSAATGACAP